MIFKDPPVLVTSQYRANLTEAPGRGRGSGSALNLPAPFCGWCRSCEQLCKWYSNAGPVCQRKINSAAAREAAAGADAGELWVGRHRRAGGTSCWLEGTLPVAWQQRAGHLQWDAELPAEPRCQHRSSLLPQAHERVVENHRATAKESLMKVSRCSSTGAGVGMQAQQCCCGAWGGRNPLRWVCSCSPAGAGCPNGGGRRGRQHGAAVRWSLEGCPDGCSSSPFLQESQQTRGERIAARKEELEQVGWSGGSSLELSVLMALALRASVPVPRVHGFQHSCPTWHSHCFAGEAAHRPAGKAAAG